MCPLSWPVLCPRAHCTSAPRHAAKPVPGTCTATQQCHRAAGPLGESTKSGPATGPHHPSRAPRRINPLTPRMSHFSGAGCSLNFGASDDSPRGSSYNDQAADMKSIILRLRHPFPVPRPSPSRAEPPRRARRACRGSRPPLMVMV